jgi:EAL domain-containing protein (putative c-di-GMP-specific phosphodiesterase class I)
MDEISNADMLRLSGLYSALAPVVVELDENDIVTYVVGAPADLLGVHGTDIVGECFVEFIHEKDVAIWKLIRHKITKRRHLGPLPIRLKHAEGTKGAFEVHVARGASAAGTLLLSIAPYHGQLSLGENKRPASSLARKFEKEDFSSLAKRLRDYVGDGDKSVSDALVSLAGIGSSSDTGTEASLWALYSLLFDAASEGAAQKLAAKKRKEFAEGKRTETEEQAQKDVIKVSGAVRDAYQKEGNETNYVTVAGADGISEAEAVKAAVYAMKKAAGAGNAKTMKALTGGYEQRLASVKNQLRTFKQIVLQEKFEVALQPIVNLKTGEVHHFEALARFDSSFYNGSPFEFMCFAEDVGVIQEFDLAMTLKVISLLKRTRRLGYNVGAAVNISGRSIQSQAFLRNFFRILEDCSDIRHLLSFELTESSQIDDLETTNRVLSRIRDFGHKVALDDFGAGAAGLQYLRVLKVDVVKIDGIYIRKGIEEEENRSFLRSMAELCTGLGIKTVGECVENETQRQFLDEIGVTYAQGWLYGKPVPVDEALRALSHPEAV